MSESHDSPAFIRALLTLDPSHQRAALAALRSSLRDGCELEAAPYVLPYGITPAEEQAAFLVAGLFALHPERGSASLAAAMRRVRDDTQSESVEHRFRALLSAGRAELPTHLRHAVALVASKGIALDWADLFRAVRDWDADGAQRAKRRWARDFWSDASPTTSNDT
ncbi:MAG: type I-E CRISPR-associated protein Cse2/CasB [Sandaracinaceae bacterium]